ncbi:DUF6444 domain-containing protein [Saccharopolyspora pogona]|uniref:DUF6444 domain-containing protein n=1 Tax=Saccharopolyspora pogona TaxID=333966 RepID=UPI0016879707|nr:DUF6444 domain-containing protein [Saccharopolyspora pogona]
MRAPEEMTRDELIELVGEQGARIAVLGEQIAVLGEQIAVRDRQITAMAEVAEVNEALGERLAKLEHALSRNSKNSSSAPSKDDGPGRTPPPAKAKRGGALKRKGKQPGAPGANLAWTDSPGDHKDRFPGGLCECGSDLAGARDLGVVDRYQQHEIPPGVGERSPSTTSTRCAAAAAGCTPLPARKASVPARWATAPTCRLSLCTSWSCTSFP